MKRLLRQLVWLWHGFLRWQMERAWEKFRRAQRRYWKALLAQLKRRRMKHVTGAPDSSEMAVEFHMRKDTASQDNGLTGHAASREGSCSAKGGKES